MRPSAIAALEVDEVSKSYGSTPALVEASWTFAPGVTVVLGRNGAGKSTLCRILAGVETPDSGALRTATDDDGALGVGQVRALSGYMPQHLAFPRGVRVGDYLAYAAWLKGAVDDEIDTAVDRALDAVLLPVTVFVTFGVPSLVPPDRNLLYRNGDLGQLWIVGGAAAVAAVAVYASFGSVGLVDRVPFLRGRTANDGSDWEA